MYNLKAIFILLFTVTTIASDLPIIEISNGLIQGTLKKSYDGRPFSSFEGIPFAKPPIGEKRFEPPEEPYNWTGRWIADTQHSCLQLVFNSGIIGQEDCLYINVYVPRTIPTSEDNLNVIVHIHGGAFMFGSGHYYSGPKYLMDKEVIFVTMNYRLGPFGFLSTGDDVVPGNNGMKDQVLALKWIQKNIKYFGGNPQSVTITGMSAGAGSVHLHYFSPLSKGLFHRGVSQSGTALSAWAIQEIIPERTRNTADRLGCPKGTSRELVEYLRSRSGNQILEAIENLYVFDGYPPVLFGPVIEKQNDEAFLTTHPYKMLIDKTVLDVPWIASVTAEEGEFIAHVFSKNITRIFKLFDNLAPDILEFGEDIRDKMSITKQIKQHYLKNPEDLDGIIRLFSDRYFTASTGESLKLQAKANKSPVYFYIFGYRGQNGFADYFLADTAHIGSSHGDDVLYYLHTAVSKETLTPSDEKIKNIFLEWLTNYANNQEPKIDTVSWKSVTGAQSLEYLHIKSPDEIYMDSVEDLGSNIFWNQLDLDGFQNDGVIRDEL